MEERERRRGNGGEGTEERERRRGNGGKGTEDWGRSAAWDRKTEDGGGGEVGGMVYEEKRGRRKEDGE
jgi:hypothetical protein